MSGECLAVDSSVTPSVYAMYNCDTELEGFVCKKRKNSFIALYVGKTGASCYGGSLLQGHVIQKLLCRWRNCRQQLYTNLQKNNWRHRTMDARILFEISIKSHFIPQQLCVYYLCNFSSSKVNHEEWEIHELALECASSIINICNTNDV